MVKKGKLGQVCLLLVCVGAALSAQEWSGSESVGVEVKDPRGRPIENAKVMLTYSGQSGGVGPPLVATDSRGQAVITGLVLGQWQIEVTHPDYLSYVGVLHMRPGKKAAVSTSFLEAAGTSLTPVKVKFFNAKNATASPPIGDERPDLPQLAAKQAQPVEPEPAPAAPVEVQEPPQPVVRSDQPPRTVTPPVGTYARDDEEPTTERDEVSKAAEPQTRPETTDQEPPQPISVSSPEPKPEPAVEVEPASEPPIQAPPEPEPETRPEIPSRSTARAEPAPQPTPSPKPEVKAQPIPEPQVQTQPQTEAIQSEAAQDQSEPLTSPPPLPEVPVPEAIPESAVETAPEISPESAIETASETIPKSAAEPEPKSDDEAPSQTRRETPTESALETQPKPPAEPSASQTASADETEPIPTTEPDQAIEATAVPAQIEPQPPEAALPRVETTPAAEPMAPLEETRAQAEEPATTTPPAAAPTPETVAEPPVESQHSKVVPAPLAGVIGMGSYRDDTCPDCEDGEWASANSKLVGADLGDATCDQELIDTVETAMSNLGDSINLELAGYLGPVFSPAGSDALDLLESDIAKPFQDRLQPHVDGSSSCQIVAMVVPKAVRYTKTRYFAADHDSSRECSPGADCGLDNARWATSAQVEKGYSATVVWALFENTAHDRERRATLSVYFRPPNATWQPRTLGGQ